MLGDTATQDRMRNAGQEYAKQFDGDKVANQLLTVYDGITAGRALP